MSTQLENVLIDCLRDTLNVMVCTGSDETSRTIERVLKRYPTYSIFHADSLEVAETLFRQVKAWHGLIIDGQSDGAEALMTAAQQFSPWLPQIVLADQTTAEKLYDQADLEEQQIFSIDKVRESEEKMPIGGVNLVVSCPLSQLSNMLPILQVWSIKRKLVAREPEGLMEEAMKALFYSNPQGVEEWSSMVGAKPRKFQREFKLFTNLPPKKMLALYHAYRIAFDVLDERNHKGVGIFPAYMVDARAKSRMMEYVLTRRSTLLSSAY
ncbi:MAG: hypothetical protein ACOCW2_03360 [Chitinivibrionales bacterium]